jgi:hypothetical protein
MSKQLRAGLLTGIVMALAGSSSHAVDQKAVDRAIADGVKALRDMQTEDGTWPPHKETNDAAKIGATVLAGLTLLECGAKADDPAVLRAADAVRRASVKPAEDSSISPTARTAADLAKSTGRRHGLLLNVYRDGKGVEFTEALALAIPQLSGDLQRKTRRSVGRTSDAHERHDVKSVSGR